MNKLPSIHFPFNDIPAFVKDFVNNIVSYPYDKCHHSLFDEMDIT